MAHMVALVPSRVDSGTWAGPHRARHAWDRSGRSGSASPHRSSGATARCPDRTGDGEAGRTLARRKLLERLQEPRGQRRDEHGSRAAGRIGCASWVDGCGRTLNWDDPQPGRCRCQDPCGAQLPRPHPACYDSPHLSRADEDAIRAWGSDFEIDCSSPADVVKHFPEPAPRFHFPRWRRGP